MKMERNRRFEVPSRFGSAVLCVILLCALLLPVFALPVAAAAHKPSFYLTPITCKPGEEVIVYLRAVGATGLQAGNCEIRYDRTVLECLSIEAAPDATDAELIVDGDVGDGEVTVGFFHIEEVTAEYDMVNVAKLVFRSVGKEGASRLELALTTLATADSNSKNMLSEAETLYADVLVAANADSKHLVSEGGTDFDWDVLDAGRNVDAPASSDSSFNYVTLMLVGGIVVVAAVGAVVVVSVLKRKKTDVNPNRIDMNDIKKEK